MTRRDPQRRSAWRPGLLALEDRHLLTSSAIMGRASEVRTWHPQTVSRPDERLFIEPQAGRAPILRAIASARSQIRLGICNLSDPRVVDALIAASERGVAVRVIVDRADELAKPPEQAQIARLIAGGVAVHLSNPVFPQSFEKLLVIDRREALIMTLCLVTPTFEDTRDYGVAMTRRGVVRETTRVFDNDWAYSSPQGQTPPPYNPTPVLRERDLVWAPTDATSKISRLIQTARRSIDATSDVVNDPYLEGLLIAAARRGVRVRIIAPLIARNGHSNRDAMTFLRSQGVQARVTLGEFPPPDAPPSMHAKSLVIDRRTSYLGSTNLDTVSRSQDRGLGVILHLKRTVNMMRSQFQTDWAQAHTVD